MYKFFLKKIIYLILLLTFLAVHAHPMKCATCSRIAGTYHFDNGTTRAVDTAPLIARTQHFEDPLTDNPSCSEVPDNANNSLYKDCDRRSMYCAYHTATIKSEKNEEKGNVKVASLPYSRRMGLMQRYIG